MRKQFATSVQIIVLLMSFVFITSAVGQMKKNTIVKDLMEGKFTYQHIKEIQKLHKVNGGNLFSEMLGEDWVNNAWQTDYKIKNKFNGNLFTETLSEYYQNGVLERAVKNTIKYAANETIEETKTVLDENGSGNFENFALTNYTYANNQVDYTITSDWKNNAWVEEQKSLFTYENGKTKTMVFQGWDNGTWANSMRMTNTYDGDKITKILTEMWDNGAWVPSNQIVTTYNNDGNKIESRNQNWDGSAWIDFSIETWTYNSNGQLTESTYEMTFMGTTMVKTRQTYQYNTDGTLQERISQNWNIGTSSWDNMQQSLFSYKDGNMYQELVKEWDGSQYVNDERLTYTFGTPTAVDDELENNNIIPTEFSLSNYPNPFNPETTIQFNLPEETQIWLSIYDVKGNLINSLVNGENISTGSHSIIWNGLDRLNHPVPSGVYIYKLNSSQVTLTGKCTLVR
jgi:hypothetical protein